MVRLGSPATSIDEPRGYFSTTKKQIGIEA